ncbi:MAG: YkgJ family cysteine cluster protein [Planctomycetota bacterium]|nr:MAG: YkgJ family cysteine cluster protein [Planctomycetota bacterium]
MSANERHPTSGSDERTPRGPGRSPATDAEPAGRPSEPRPWYADGLRFQCTRCGNCCTGAPGFVWVTDEEIAAIADYLGTSVGEVRLLHTRLVGARVSLREYPNGDCVFFDSQTRRCTIYPVRPVQCRTWPFWRSNLASPETWQQVQATCPGAGHGPLYSLEDIRRQMEQRDV